jgi:putative peptide zinc metalloprotease protein
MKKLAESEFENIVPMLDCQIEIHPFNGTEYLVQHTTLNHQVNINTETYQLLKMIDGKKTIAELAILYHQMYDNVLYTKSIHYLLYEKLAKYGIVHQDEYKVEIRKRASYLKLSFVFLKKKHVRHLTNFLTFLFHRKLFYFLMIVMSFFIGYMIVSSYQVIVKSASNIFNLNFALYLIAFQLGTLFHELGHAAACRRFGASHGGIGFGFYLLTPVFFADVSDIWKLKASERIIVNLAGIYLEMLLATILLLFYFFNGQSVFLILPCVLILSTLRNLNPLLRFDGYWVLVDATNTPNLQKASYRVMTNKLLMLRKFQFSFVDRKEVFLFIYGMVSSVFIFLFLGSVLFYDSNAVLSLPIDVYFLFSDINKISFSEIQRLFIPFIFWYLLIRMGVKYLRKLL